MAAFCQQCSLEYFGKDFGEMKGLITKKSFEEGFVAIELCEGCGAIEVDHNGRCVSKDCPKHGKKKRDVCTGGTGDCGVDDPGS